MHLPGWHLRSLPFRLSLVAASGIFYSILYLAIHAVYGYEAIALSSIPLGVGALLLGVRGGLGVWFLIIPLNLGLRVVAGLGLTHLASEAPVRALVGLGLVVVIGRLRDLSVALNASASDREREVHQREQAEAQLRVTVAALPDVILRIGRDAVVLDFHAGQVEDLLADPARIRGSKLSEVMPSAFTEHVVPAVARTLESGQAEVAEFRHTDGRGDRDYEVRLVPSGSDEVLAIVRNVTERKSLDALVQQGEREHLDAKMKDQLAVADRHVALGTLAAGAAHEINNPLAYVISNLGFLDKRLQDFRAVATPEGVHLGTDVLSEMQDVVQEATEGAERVRVIVRDLKTFSRVDDYRTELVDVRAQLDVALKMANNEISRRARLFRDFGDVAPVKANPARLAQVFLNLLINAAQAIPEGDPATQEIRTVTRMDGASVVVEVHDSGSGIAPEARDHLFDPFFTTKEVGVGTGLGLYICQNLVMALGGTISAENRSGRGSIFRVRLPASSAPLTAVAGGLR